MWLDLRLNVRRIFAIGEIDVGSVDSNVMVLRYDAVRAHGLDQVIVLCFHNLCHGSKVVTQLFCLKFTIGGPKEGMLKREKTNSFWGVSSDSDSESDHQLLTLGVSGMKAKGNMGVFEFRWVGICTMINIGYWSSLFLSPQVLTRGTAF